MQEKIKTAMNITCDDHRIWDFKVMPRCRHVVLFRNPFPEGCVTTQLKSLAEWYASEMRRCVPHMSADSKSAHFCIWTPLDPKSYLKRVLLIPHPS